ncbi:MATE family efflux transporter [Segetibacter sp. 3557_3]|uniref:MATE family efflux transporter n=1 Tax=Segetibacter sp. 3557_3 TaxID=2547429 RepID=UPI001058D781|nr:MATE family efflux transporter [Segetibacter sp. 3557_3]TDH20035.1 MATE family efflux transporter [Segetibacter sp. 3557_3]
MKKEFLKTLVIAIPLIISNVSQIALGLIDSAMIGAIDYRQLAASALAINMLAIPQILCIGMTMAISPLVAIANGKQDHGAASRVLYNGVWLCTIITAIIVAAVLLSKNLMTKLGQDTEVVRLALPYYQVMACSLIPMIIFTAIKQFCDALEFTKTAMVLALLSLPLNALLNWIFIYGHLGLPRLELVGTGIATLITRLIMAVTLAVIVYRHKLFQPYIQQRYYAWKIDGRSWKELLQIGIPSSIQYGLESGAFAVSGIMIGWLGATTQAAHQIALNLASTTFMAALGLSLAGSIRVSNAYGRNDLTELKIIGKSTILGSLVYGSVCALLFVLFQDYLPYLFTSNPEVVSLAAGLMVLGALFQISDATQAIGVGLLRGVRDVKLPTAFVAIAYWAIGLPAGYYLAFHMGMGASGIWIGFIAGLTTSSILLNLRFIRKSHIPVAVA